MLEIETIWSIEMAMALAMLSATLIHHIKLLYHYQSILETKLIKCQQQPAPKTTPDTVSRFREMLLTNTCPTPEDWKQLREKTQKEMPEFVETLMSTRSFSDIEYHTTLLVKYGFHIKEIALLTCHSKEAICSIRRRLSQKILGNEHSSPKQWDDYIHSL